MSPNNTQWVLYLFATCLMSMFINFCKTHSFLITQVIYNWPHVTIWPPCSHKPEQTVVAWELWTCSLKVGGCRNGWFSDSRWSHKANSKVIPWKMPRSLPSKLPSAWSCNKNILRRVQCNSVTRSLNKLQTNGHLVEGLNSNRFDQYFHF
jgi:hypothetical protein